MTLSPLLAGASIARVISNATTWVVGILCAWMRICTGLRSEFSHRLPWPAAVFRGGLPNPGLASAVWGQHFCRAASRLSATATTHVWPRWTGNS